MSTTTFSTTAFEDGETVPTTYTCEGDDVSPPLSIGDVPEEAGALAVIVDDPDAPSGTFAHWLLWNVPPGTSEIPADVPRERVVASLNGTRQGTNDFGAVGYRGPCPPEGDDPHTYRFRLYVLDGALDVDAGARREDVLSAVEGRRIGHVEFTGQFARP